MYKCQTILLSRFEINQAVLGSCFPSDWRFNHGSSFAFFTVWLAWESWWISLIQLVFFVSKSWGESGKKHQTPVYVFQDQILVQKRKFFHPATQTIYWTYWNWSSVISIRFRSGFWITTPPKANMDTQNHGLEKVAPFQYGHFWYLC